LSEARPLGNAVETAAILTPLSPRVFLATPTMSPYTQTAAGRGVVGSLGSGARARVASPRTLPGVSEPSSVVRSIIEMARSIAHRLLSVLMLRVRSPAARASQPTWSTPGSPCSQAVSARFVSRLTPRRSRALGVGSVVVDVVTPGSLRAPCPLGPVVSTGYPGDATPSAPLGRAGPRGGLGSKEPDRRRKSTSWI